MRTKNTDLKDVWQTPPELLNLLRKPGTPIDLDPCAGTNTGIAETNVTDTPVWYADKLPREDTIYGGDGLSHEWGGRVFVNPPFSNKRAWLSKVVESQDDTDVIFALTPDSTDVKSWWHGYIAEEAEYVWFSRGRISYINPETGEPAGSPTFGTAISIFGQPENFVLHNLKAEGQLMETV